MKSSANFFLAFFMLVFRPFPFLVVHFSTDPCFAQSGKVGLEILPSIDYDNSII